jgi:hypothetical protein
LARCFEKSWATVKIIKTRHLLNITNNNFLYLCSKSNLIIINTMGKIEILLEKLDNRITSSLAKRLDTLDDLSEKLEASGEDYEKNPTDENRDSYNEVIDYVEKIENGIIRDLEALLEKRKAEELAKQTQATPPAPDTPPANQSESTSSSDEKKKGSGVLTLVIGGVLLVASLGAINYFKKQ